MEASVSLKKIGKNIEKESILAGLSFGIERGSITSIIGPNDSGKSLLLNMIAGGLSPDFGSIYINGNNIVNREKKIFSKIGYMPQYINLDENLNILENFQFHARLYEMNQPGVLYEMDTTQNHTALNLGWSDRVHMVGAFSE